jgi:hypothetical protein
MRKFENDGKINFVDENNVFVGYDMGQCCCENADWFVSKNIPEKIIDSIEINFHNFVFDIDFFEEGVISEDNVDNGGSVLFRLVSKDKTDDAYLCLYNCHNGYYGHGFDMEIGGQSLRSGCL